MFLKSIGAKVLAKNIVRRINYWASNPVETQQKVFRQLLSKAKQTSFGKDNNFDKITNYNDFKEQVPVRDYEDLKDYI